MRGDTDFRPSSPYLSGTHGVVFPPAHIACITGLICTHLSPFAGCSQTRAASSRSPGTRSHCVWCCCALPAACSGLSCTISVLSCHTPVPSCPLCPAFPSVSQHAAMLRQVSTHKAVLAGSPEGITGDNPASGPIQCVYVPS